MRVEVFFYGLFMDMRLLRERGLHPANPRHAWVDGFALRIGERATLVPASGRVHGILATLPEAELTALYSDPSVAGYRAEMVTAHVDAATPVGASCYNLPADTALGPANSRYATRLADLAHELDLPQEYVRRIRELA